MLVYLENQNVTEISDGKGPPVERLSRVADCLCWLGASAPSCYEFNTLNLGRSTIGYFTPSFLEQVKNIQVGKQLSFPPQTLGSIWE